MDARTDIREFLTTRRARISPEDVGLPTYGGMRRVPGLRREEAALLSGVSVDYYTKLERGNVGGVSDSVLDAIARALRLNEVERAHLFALVRACAGQLRARPGSADAVRPSIHRTLMSLSTPAYIRNRRMDVLAANDLGFALYDGILVPERLPVNLGRFIFLDPSAPEFFVEWDTIADDLVATLRGEVGRNRHDKGLSDLVGELATRSEEFGERWGRHNVKRRCTASKQVLHPVVGNIQLTADALELPDDGLTLISYTADPGTPADDALRFLASWATRPDASGTASPADAPVDAPVDPGDGPAGR